MAGRLGRVLVADHSRRRRVGCRLLEDLAVGQRLLQVGDARLGGFRVVEVECLQPGHSLMTQQPRVADLLRQDDRLQVSHSLEVQQSGIGDLAAKEPEFNNFALFIAFDRGTDLLQRSNGITVSSLSRRRRTTPTPTSAELASHRPWLGNGVPLSPPQPRRSTQGR